MEKCSELQSWIIRVGLPETVAHESSEGWLGVAGANGLPPAMRDICTAARPPLVTPVPQACLPYAVPGAERMEWLGQDGSVGARRKTGSFSMGHLRGPQIEG